MHTSSCSTMAIWAALFSKPDRIPTFIITSPSHYSKLIISYMMDSHQGTQPEYQSARRKAKRKDLFETARIGRSIFSSSQNQSDYENESEHPMEQNKKIVKSESLPAALANVGRIEKGGSCGLIGIIEINGRHEDDFDQPHESTLDKMQKKQEKGQGNDFIFQGTSSDSEGSLEELTTQGKHKIIFEDHEDGEQPGPESKEKEKENNRQKGYNRKVIQIFGEKVKVDVELTEDGVRSEGEDKQTECQSSQKPKQLLRSTSIMAQNTFAKLKLTRDKSLTGGTVFILCLQANLRFILACKHVSSQTFILSNSINNFQQNGPEYIGKIKTSFFGNELSLYGRGLNPQKAKETNSKPRQLICTVVSHSQKIMQEVKPRDFTVYLLKAGVNYYTDLLGTTMYEDEVALSKLHQDYETNKDKITVYENRKSKWNEKEKMYSLNMKGRAKLPSIKNFIVESPSEDSRDIMLLGKMADNQFSFDIHHPMSPMVGMAIALTSFTHKSW